MRLPLYVACFLQSLGSYFKAGKSRTHLLVWMDFLLREREWTRNFTVSLPDIEALYLFIVFLRGRLKGPTKVRLATLSTRHSFKDFGHNLD